MSTSARWIGWDIRRRRPPAAVFAAIRCVLLLSLQQIVGVGGQYSGIPNYAQKEAQMVVAGGCTLDAVAVYNRACALISETLPFYYKDEMTNEIKVNESLAETNIRWVCWGQAWKNNFADVNPAGWYNYAVGFGMGRMMTACGIEFDTYKIICFGANNPSQDDQGLTSRGQAEPPLGKFKQLDVGGLHGCAIPFDLKTETEFDSTLVCWGNNRMGQTNVPLIVQTSALVKISYTYVQLGWEHTCAFRSDHRLTCWGSNLDAATNIANGVRATKAKDGDTFFLSLSCSLPPHLYLSLSLSVSPSLSLSLAVSFSLSCCLFRSFSPLFSLSHSLLLSLFLSFTLSLTLSVSLAPSRTHKHTHTLHIAYIDTHK